MTKFQKNDRIIHIPKDNFSNLRAGVKYPGVVMQTETENAMLRVMQIVVRMPAYAILLDNMRSPESDAGGLYPAFEDELMPESVQ